MENIAAKPALHLFVCTNERIPGSGDDKPSCGPRVTQADVKNLKQWIADQGLSQRVYVTRTGCLGFCNTQASVACLYPAGQFVKFHKVEQLKQWLSEAILHLG